MRLPGLHRRHLALLGVLALLAGTMALLSEHFLSAANLLGMTRHLAEVGIIACGMTLIIMSGGIDLSVGSLLALCSIVLGYSWQVWGLGPLAAVGLALTVGAAGGALNGALVTRGGFPPLVATLGTMALFRGVALRISEARPVSGFPAAFEWIGQGHLGPVPVQTVVWTVVALATGVLLSRTPIGLFTRAIGDNERAARFAALPVGGVKLGLYTGTGLLAALAALIATARFSTARADAGAGLELEVIAAVVLGGTAITGGRGSVGGTLLGVLILGVARNGLTLAGVEQEWRSMMTGTILIAAAISDRWIAGRGADRGRRSPALPPATEAS
jgi:rhamnose transport system permease protein